MDLQLTGRHVLITGGSKGIGLACARAFLEEGARVTLVSRNVGHLHAAAEQLKAPAGRLYTVPADLQDAAAALAALDQAEGILGPVEVLINSAGAARRTPPDELTPQVWHDAMQAKYFSYLHMMDPLIKRMAQRGQGAIVNIVGSGGKVANPVHLPGGAANAALMLVSAWPAATMRVGSAPMSAGLAAAYGSRGVRVNAVNPGLTATGRVQEGMLAEARQHGISTDEALQRATARLPLGRLAEPDEIANAVLFLASPKASYVTGAVLAMDGALTPMI